MTLTVYSTGTPNGKRPLVFLEVLGIKFNYKRIDITKNEQQSEEFLKINPYGKIPAITDIDPNTNETINIFETGAILEFLASKYDSDLKYHYPQNHPLYWEQQKWFYLTTAELSPKQENLSFYLNFALQRDDFAIERADNETRRIYKVLDSRLEKNNGWLVGDKINIADISAFPFIRRHEFVKIDLQNDFPNVYAWLLKLQNVDGTERGYAYV